MSEHFIKKITIKKHKCFNDFEAEGLARVNLITGKNNVGKTAFLEACYINVQSIDTIMYALKKIKNFRETLNISHESKNTDNDNKECLEQANGVNIKSNINHISFNIEEKNGAQDYHFTSLKGKISNNVNNLSFNTKQIPNILFIDNFGFSNLEIVNNFEAVQKLDEENFLNETLYDFDNTIENFKIIGDKPQCKIQGTYRDITELGDGTRHLVSIVVSLYKCKDGYLFIDEIDNGIHYEQLDSVWRIILEVSKALQVQVFATTHSKECLESYARVAEQLKDEDITLIRLARLKSGIIKAGVFDYSVLESAISQEHEVRG